MANKNIKGTKPQVKTDYNIPKFSLKSSLIILLGAVGATIIFPYLVSLLGLSYKVGVVVGNTLILGFILAYVRFFVENKIGFCKKFWMTYIGFAIVFGCISFLWMYLNIYV